MILKKRDRVAHPTVAMLSLALAGLVLAGCTSTHAAPGVINVVGAENQYGDVLAQIGGPFVQVTSVMNNPNTDPHNFEASPLVARAIADAQLVVQNGAGYDTFMNQLESASPSATRHVVTVQDLLHVRAAPNPHFWYSPTAMALVAKNVANVLAQISPRHAQYFHARGSAFQHQWRTVLAAEARATSRYRGADVATTEPVADFLLSAMGLHNVTPFRFQANVMNGIDPSPEDIVIQQRLLSRHVVKALCFNAQVSSPVTVALRNLATHDHVPIVAVYETMPTGLHVQTWMLEEINAIEAALTNGTSTASIG